MTIEMVLEMVREWIRDPSTTTPSNLEAAASYVADVRLSVGHGDSAKYSALYFAAYFAARTTPKMPHYAIRATMCLEEYYILTR